MATPATRPARQLEMRLCTFIEKLLVSRRVSTRLQKIPRGMIKLFRVLQQTLCENVGETDSAARDRLLVRGGG